MDMKEMVEKVKKGEPLYGDSTLSPYMQGVAARNSRYSQIFLHAMPWFNFVNHNQVSTYRGRLKESTNIEQHGVDTAKYYKAAEEELERERLKKAGY